MPPPTSVVCDTGVLVSSLFGGPPRAVMNLWRDQQLVLCLSDDTAAEFLQILAGLGEVRQEVRELLSLLCQEERVMFVGPREEVRQVAPDPEQDKFLECAVAAGAQALISQEEELFKLGQFRGIPLLDPEAFLDWFRDDRP